MILTQILFSVIQSTTPLLFCSVFEVDRSASVKLVGPAFSYSHGLGLGSDKMLRETPFHMYMGFSGNCKPPTRYKLGSPFLRIVYPPWMNSADPVALMGPAVDWTLVIGGARARPNGRAVMQVSDK